MKKKLVLKPFVLPMLYIILVVTIMMFATKVLYDRGKTNEGDGNQNYVSDTVFDNTVPVVGTTDSYVLSPYSGEGVSEKIGYYNYNGEQASQEKSIIKYENTYLQNTGITYSSDNEFSVIAVMDGKVTKVYDNDILGQVVEITHDNNYITVYQMISNVNVKVDDEIRQGDTIAKSGTSKLMPTGNNLHFEVLKDGTVRDPNTVIGVNTNSL